MIMHCMVLILLPFQMFPFAWLYVGIADNGIRSIDVGWPQMMWCSYQVSWKCPVCSKVTSGGPFSPTYIHDTISLCFLNEILIKELKMHTCFFINTSKNDIAWSFSICILNCTFLWSLFWQFEILIMWLYDNLWMGIL
jgi:hypothetical protein